MAQILMVHLRHITAVHFAAIEILLEVLNIGTGISWIFAGSAKCSGSHHSCQSRGDIPDG